MKISVSFLKSNLKLKDTIKKLNKSSCDFIHVDYMDGKFVPHKSFELQELNVLRNSTKPLDVHLMVEHPLKYISYFKKMNVKYITFHVESKDDINSVIKEIRNCNIGVGIAINPDTPLYDLLPYIPYVDVVLIMSVYPGMGGQKFIDNTLNIIDKLNKYRGNILLNVDGGINEDTIKLVKTDIVVSGSYVCMNDDYDKQISNLRSNSYDKEES